ncbi:MAG: DMT family transporter [Thermomicrobiales bacterium]
MLPILCGLGAATCVGVGDFIAGLTARRMAPLQVGFWVQLLALPIAAIMLLIVRPPLEVWQLGWGLAAGLGSGIGLALLYRALACGAMSLVSPIVACAVVLPVIVSIARGEEVTTLSAAGIVAVFAGIVLASLQPAPVVGDPTDTDAAGDRQAIMLAIGSAVAFGLFLVLIDFGVSGSGAGSLWTTSASRVSAFGIQSVLIFFSSRRVDRPGPLWPRLAGAAALDQGANTLLGIGAVTDAYGIVTILFGLYPVVTALLGTVLLGERLTRLQTTGATLAVIGVLLVSV